MKFYFRKASLKDLNFLLKPINRIFEIVNNSQALFSEHIGYYHSNCNMTIDKSCSGYNFLLLSFIMIYFLSLNYITKRYFKKIALIASFLFSYLITILANSSRIVTAVIFQDKLRKIYEIDPKILHESIGIVIYLAFLITAFLLFEGVLKKYEKAL